MRALVADLRAKVADVGLGGGEAARARHTSRAASCCRATASRALLDPGSPFLELSPLAAHGMYDGEVPAPASSPASAASPGANA